MNQNTLPNQSNIEQYALWTTTTWFNDRGDDISNLAVMGFGLAGESGEFIEVFLHSLNNQELDRDLLKKELGDFIYYWARICIEYNISPSELIAKNRGESFSNIDNYLPNQIHDLAQKPLLKMKSLLEHTVAVSQVMETIKKDVRDTFTDIPKLENNMYSCFATWLHICQQFDFKPSEVLQENMMKVNNRVKNGTLKGSGNYR